MTTSHSTALRAVALAAALGLGAFGPATALPVRLALSALGDLTPYRTIAADTLAMVDRGDIPAARARIKDLETAWDKAEATLKPKDKATWTLIDGMIDAVLTDIRRPAPTPAACAVSLKALIVRLDGIDKA